MDCLTRVYPCGECAEHWGKVVAATPVESRSGPALRQWVCQAHNKVNQRLNKPIFDCSTLEGRWPQLTCEGQTACEFGIGVQHG